MPLRAGDPGLTGQQWAWDIVGLGEEALDGGLEIDQGSEHAELQPSLAQLGEKTLHGIEPGGRFRRVVEGEARMAIEPGLHFGVFVTAGICRGRT